MSDNAYFPRLFSSLEVGERTLRNRVVLSATLTNFGAGHRVTERWTNFLAERAKGGCGAIVTEVIAVDPAALSHGAIVTGYDKENEDGFKRTAEAVEGAGACLIAQLWHPGRQQLWSPVWSPKGISDQPDAYSWTVPHVMTTDELRQVIEEYVSVAQRLKRCGFGGVELHGAHGYLISQILSPWSNQRSDAYGGSLENRVRFVAEVCDAIRSTCGKDFVIGLKMPGDEGVEGGIDPDEAARITAALVRHGTLDYFAYSQGNFTNSLENHVPDMHFRRAPFLDIHKKIRPAAGGKPVMAIGRIAMPAEAEAAIVEGAGDLVGMTRALIADADWPNKAREGRVNDIRPSSYDNFAWGEIHLGKPLAEIHNPQLGAERRIQLAAGRRHQEEAGCRGGRRPGRPAGGACGRAARTRRDARERVTATRRQTAVGGGAARSRGISQPPRLDGTATARRGREDRAGQDGDAGWPARARARGRDPRYRLSLAAAERCRGRCIRSRLGRISGERPLRQDGSAVRHGPQRRDVCGGGRPGRALPEARAAHPAHADRPQRELLQCHRRPPPALPGRGADRRGGRAGLVPRRRADLAQCFQRTAARDPERRPVSLGHAAHCRRRAGPAVATGRRRYRLVGDCVAPRNLLCAIHEGEAAAMAI